MRFEWDENKDRSRRKKHGLSFATARLVFDDPFHLSLRDRFEGHEERWRTVGLAGNAVLLVVAHTFRNEGDDETIRIISARKATKHERERYEQGD